MGVFWVEQAGVESGFVAEKQEAFRIGIEPAQGIYILGESKLSQGVVGGAIRRELGNHSIGFMKGEEHARRFG
jgi:hypothetical protein